MKGITRLVLNQETIIAALQKYFTEDIFDANQLAEVTNVEPSSIYDAHGVSTWEYAVTVDSDPDHLPVQEKAS